MQEQVQRNVDVLLWPQVAGVVASSAVGGDEIRLDLPNARLHLHEPYSSEVSN